MKLDKIDKLVLGGVLFALFLAALVVCWAEQSEPSFFSTHHESLLNIATDLPTSVFGATLS